MSMNLSRQGQVVNLSLSGELTISDAAVAYHRLSGEIDGEVSLVIDAQQVTCMDTSIAQILVWASRRVHDVRVEHRSAAWDESLRLLGLETDLTCDGSVTRSHRK